MVDPARQTIRAELGGAPRAAPAGQVRERSGKGASAEERAVGKAKLRADGGEALGVEEAGAAGHGIRLQRAGFQERGEARWGKIEPPPQRGRRQVFRSSCTHDHIITVSKKTPPSRGRLRAPMQPLHRAMPTWVSAPTTTPWDVVFHARGLTAGRGLLRSPLAAPQRVSPPSQAPE